MKKPLLVLAVTVICCACVLTSCSTKHKKEQLLEVYDVHGSEGKARLTVNGKVLFTTDVYVGKHGVGKTREGDSMTPVGTFHPLTAFGVKPNPGTAMPYINVTPTIFACDDSCQYYNQIIDTAVVHHRCGGEEMFSYQPQYTITASLPISTRSASIPTAATSSSTSRAISPIRAAASPSTRSS